MKEQHSNYVKPKINQENDRTEVLNRTIKIKKTRNRLKKDYTFSKSPTEGASSMLKEGKNYCLLMDFQKSGSDYIEV